MVSIPAMSNRTLSPFVWEVVWLLRQRWVRSSGLGYDIPRKRLVFVGKLVWIDSSSVSILIVTVWLASDFQRRVSEGFFGCLPRGVVRSSRPARHGQDKLGRSLETRCFSWWGGNAQKWHLMCFYGQRKLLCIMINNYIYKYLCMYAI